MTEEKIAIFLRELKIYKLLELVLAGSEKQSSRRKAGKILSRLDQRKYSVSEDLI